MRPRFLCCVAVTLLMTLAIKPTAGAGNPAWVGYFFTFQQSFDSVTAPNLPAGWTATQPTGQLGDPLWVTSTTNPYTGPNAAFAPDLDHVVDNLLDTPSMTIPGAVQRPALVFWHSYNLENGFDGGVVEIKIGAGSFTDIITAGGAVLNSGYTGVISSCCGNPLAGRQAFTGNSNGYIRSMFKLPPAALGQSVQFRFRIGCDSTLAQTGWRVDTVLVTSFENGEYDFNGDYTADRTIFRPSNNVWYTALTGGGSMAVGWGTAGDLDVSADYDGDGKNDVAVWRPSNGTWFIIRSSDSVVETMTWGQNGDVPLTGPAECCSVDGKADLVIWRPSNGTWFINRSTGQPPHIFSWGTNGDYPILGDYGGVFWIQDAVIYRPSTGVWYINTDGGQSGFTLVMPWGAPGDVPVVGDWDGDGRNDVAIFRPSNGQWWIHNSFDNSTTIVAWGMNGDIPVTGDFNGDGRTDFTVWRPSNGVWFTQFSNTGTSVAVGWGVPGDVPVGRRPGS